MANHKKVKPPQARAHCSMCKPWKDGRIARDSEGFEAHSARVARDAASDAVRESQEGEPSCECGSLSCCGGTCPTSCAGNGDE